jgi:hypothetical protein
MKVSTATISTSVRRSSGSLLHHNRGPKTSGGGKLHSTPKVCRLGSFVEVYRAKGGLTACVVPSNVSPYSRPPKVLYGLSQEIPRP